MITITILLHTYRKDSNDYVGYIGEEKILVDPFVTCLWPQISENDRLTNDHYAWAQQREGQTFLFTGHFYGAGRQDDLRVFLPDSDGTYRTNPSQGGN